MSSIHIHLYEWQKTTFASHSQLAGLLLPADASTQRTIQELADSRRLIILQQRNGIQLEATAYVGRIAIGDLHITIRPKIAVLPLLRLIQYTYGLRQLNLISSTSFNIEVLSFQDLLIAQLAQEVGELLARGLQRHYVQKDELLTSPRGRISFQKISNRGGIMQAALPCSHHLRQEDSLLNQVVLGGVQLGIQLSNDTLLRTKLQRLAHQHFAHIASVSLNWQVLGRARRVIDRLTTRYASILTLIEILLASTGISVEEPQQSLPLPGFLFDMNRFFENLLLRFLSEHLPAYEVRSQFVLDSVMQYRENPRRRQAPRLRPDYVIQHKGKTIAILDAKYRDLWQKDLPADMLYQLLIYALGQASCNHATILYPTTQTGTLAARIEMRVPAHTRGQVQVILRPVDLLHLDMLLQQSRERNNVAARTSFALALLGPPDGSCWP